MEDLIYEKSTGKLFRNNKEIGYRTNLKGRTQYLRASYKGKQYAVHRLIWEKHYGKIPKDMQIDHINGDGLDNRLENLRLATRVQNSQNKRLYKNNTSGYKGVNKAEGRNGSVLKNPWRVSLYFKGKKFYSKHGFTTPEDAARHYNKKAVELFGTFARLNDVE